MVVTSEALWKIEADHLYSVVQADQQAVLASSDQGRWPLNNVLTAVSCALLNLVQK